MGEIPTPVIRRYLPKSPVILEAGAHVGLDTVKLAAAWPTGEIHAFEPVPAIFDQLKTRVHGLKNVKCYRLAVGRENGSAKIHVSGGESDGSSSLLKPKDHLTLHPEVSFTKPITIKVTSIDSWAKARGIAAVDFLWLDLQGLELAALKGATHVLKKVSAIHAEVNLVEVYENVPLYAELRSWLEKRGFKVAFEAIDWDDGGNVLFVRAG